MRQQTYLMDLQPENSFVRYMVERGYNTFLISWKSAYAIDGPSLTWEDYVQHGLVAAMSVVRGNQQPEGQTERSRFLYRRCAAVGRCAADDAGAGQDWLESMTLMTAMVRSFRSGRNQEPIDWNLIRRRRRRLAGAGRRDFRRGEIRSHLRQPAR